MRRSESVLVLVYTAAGEVLLLHRVQPVFWQSVTGGLEIGETPAQAAERELAEETGLLTLAMAAGKTDMRTDGVDVIDCLYKDEFEIRAEWRHKYPPGLSVNTEHVFRCRLPARQPIRLSREEHSEYCWLPVHQAIETAWSWSNKQALEKFVLPEF